MKFNLTRSTSRWNGTIIHINTLEELIQFISENEGRVVIHQPDNLREHWELEVYDCFRE